MRSLTQTTQLRDLQCLIKITLAITANHLIVLHISGKHFPKFVPNVGALKQLGVTAGRIIQRGLLWPRTVELHG